MQFKYEVQGHIIQLFFRWAKIILALMFTQCNINLFSRISQTKHKTSGHNPLNSSERMQFSRRDRPAVLWCCVLVQALHWFNKCPTSPCRHCCQWKIQCRTLNDASHPVCSCCFSSWSNLTVMTRIHFNRYFLSISLSFESLKLICKPVCSA